MDPNSFSSPPIPGSADISELKASRMQKTPELEALTATLADLSSALRLLEDKYANIRKKTQLTDQTLLDLQKSFSKEKRLLNDEMIELKGKFQELRESFDMMKTELKDTAKQNDLKVIEKYLDYWEPMEFVTKKEVREVLQEKGILPKDEEE